MRLRAPLLAFVLALLLGSCAQGAAEHPTLLFHNAAVWTADDARPRAEAVAIRDARIVAVGTDAEVLPLAGPATEVIDLDGAFVTPGFIDTHVHFASAARFLEFNLMRTTAQDAFEHRVREVVETLPPGEWILGGFWGAYDEWAAGSAGGQRRVPFTPDVRRVEAITARHPLFIRKFDGSAFAANRAALAAAGLDPDDPQAPGVIFERDAENRPTGLFHGEGAALLFRDAVPQTFTRERRLAQTRHALGVARRYGVTSISDMSDDEQLALYRALHDSSALTVRVDFRYPLDRWNELAEQGIRAGAGDAWIRLGGLKGHIDGIMGTSSARFFEPYAHDPGNRGRWRRLMVDENGDPDPARFLDLLLAADAAGLQLTIHAIGDEANALLLDFLGVMERENGARDRRFRLVHAQVIHPDDFARLGEHGVIAEVQPYHLSDDMRWMEERIGPERSRGAYAFRSIQESGARLAFGSDWPGTSASEYPIDPMLGLYAAVTRQTVTGEPPEGWFPEERISMEDALRAYTRDAAYTSFEESRKGTLAPGMLADLAVLSQNLLEIDPAAVLDTKVRYTVVDGQIVYRARDEELGTGD